MMKVPEAFHRLVVHLMYYTTFVSYFGVFVFQGGAFTYQLSLIVKIDSKYQDD